MFKIIIRLAIVFLIHIILFASYPETGKNGNLFLGISLFCWTALLFMASTLLRTLSSGGKLLTTFIMLVFYGLTIGTTAYLMPQADKTTVYDKLLKGNYPTFETFKHGLKRFGLDFDSVSDSAGNAIKEKQKQIENINTKEIADKAGKAAGELADAVGEDIKQLGETITK